MYAELTPVSMTFWYKFVPHSSIALETMLARLDILLRLARTYLTPHLQSVPGVNVVVKKSGLYGPGNGNGFSVLGMEVVIGGADDDVCIIDTELVNSRMVEMVRVGLEVLLMLGVIVGHSCPIRHTPTVENRGLSDSCAYMTEQT